MFNGFNFFVTELVEIILQIQAETLQIRGLCCIFTNLKLGSPQCEVCQRQSPLLLMLHQLIKMVDGVIKIFQQFLHSFQHFNVDCVGRDFHVKLTIVH